MVELVKQNYSIAKKMYAKLGVNTDKVLEKAAFPSLPLRNI